MGCPNSYDRRDGNLSRHLMFYHQNACTRVSRELKRWLLYSAVEPFNVSLYLRYTFTTIRRYEVANLIEDQCYEPEGFGFDVLMEFLRFVIDLIPPAAPQPWSRLSLTEMGTRDFCWGVKMAGA